MTGLFLKIINMSISASWLIMAVLICRLVLKKAPKWVNVLLWGIVAVRLLLPFSVESVLSLIPSAETITPEIMMGASPTINTARTSQPADMLMLTTFKKSSLMTAPPS